MDGILEILTKIGDVSVTVGEVVKGLIVFLGGFLASKKTNPPKQQ